MISIEKERQIKLAKELLDSHSKHLEKAEKELFCDPFDNSEIIENTKLTDEPWIETFTGRRFCPLNPNINSIVIQDIAHALSMICRFTGHAKNFYSVAEHSVLVSYICDTKDSLHGLMHDASEFALQDISSPLKKTDTFAMYRKAEKNLQDMIYKRFSLSQNEPESVKRADLQLLATEARDLLLPRNDWPLEFKPLPFKIMSLSPAEAEKLFLERFDELFSKHNHNSQCQ